METKHIIAHTQREIEILIILIICRIGCLLQT